MASLGRVQRIDRPSPALLALTVRAPQATEVLLLGARPPAWGAGLVDHRPRGAPADAFTQGLRRRLTGAEVLRVEEVTGALSVALVLPAPPAGASPPRPPTHAANAWLVLSRATHAFWLVSAEGVVLATHPGAARPSLPTDEDGEARLSRAELRSAGPALVAAAATELLVQSQRALASALARGIKRLTRKRDAILADARRADTAPRLRLEADLLLAHGTHAQRAPDGTGWVDAQDWSCSPPTTRRIGLGRDERPADRASRLYHQARRLERGARIAEERWALAEEQLERLRALQAACQAATTPKEVERLMADAQALGLRELAEPPPREPSGRERTTRPGSGPGRLPYRRFVSREGHPIWVGRSARDNDALTLHHARPHHLWLHVQGRAGSHVIIPLTRGAVASSELLVDAAHLAAHFSDARNEPVVEVIHASRRHVVKPRGYATGAVRVDRQKTLLLRQEPARLASLLAGELRM